LKETPAQAYDKNVFDDRTDEEIGLCAFDGIAHGLIAGEEGFEDGGGGEGLDEKEREGSGIVKCACDGDPPGEFEYFNRHESETEREEYVYESPYCGEDLYVRGSGDAIVVD